jgi:hypothetical protein
MAEGMSAATADNVLNAIGNATSYSVANTYVQLHVGVPGPGGTGNLAGETGRKGPISWGAAGAGATGFRQIANDAAIQWTNITGSQDATHFSVWDASTGGNFVGSGAITANGYTAGDTYNIASGALVLSLPIAS